MEEQVYLPKIHSPADLKQLSNRELEILSAELRERIIDVVSRNGGHLSSNLGVVELTVCMHKIFDSPRDTIIFDVGHQCYAHKILTGRGDEFASIRTEGGLSGFPKPSESQHDSFTNGHSSTSISAAVGFAAAKKLLGQPGDTIAFIGDGAMTGGLAYEGLNNIVHTGNKIIIILNDNEMSISRNVGGMSLYLSRLVSRKSYFGFKDWVERFLKAIPLVGKHLFRFAVWVKNLLRRLFFHNTIFEDMGLRYLGPVDGHNIRQVCTVLERAKQIDTSVVVHFFTKKGKGCCAAEQNPGCYHSTASFDIDHMVTEQAPVPSYSSVFGQTLCTLAAEDYRICGVTAAMCAGTGMEEYAKKFPSRFFDVGIAEQHAVTFCSAMAAGGLIPFFAVYSSFLQRGFDQLIHDAAIGNYHAVFCIDRAGFVGEDGQTHHGLFDPAYLAAIPNFTVFSPSSYEELALCMRQALRISGPVAIRYPRGGEEATALPSVTDYYLPSPSDGRVLILAYGRLVSAAENAAIRLTSQGIEATAGKIVSLKPLDEECIKRIMAYPKVFFFEESALNGSVGQRLAAELLQRQYQGSYHHHSVGDVFLDHASIKSLLHTAGLDQEGMARTVIETLQGENNHLQ